MPKFRRIRLLIVDDSRFIRMALRAIVDTDPEVEVIGEARDGADAIALARVLRPDVITMDLEMPEVDGLSAIKAIMAERPTLPPSIAFSQPEFLVQRWTRQFDAAQAAAICAWNQEPSSVYVRANGLMPGAEQAVKALPGLEDIGGGFFRCEGLPRAALASGACYAQDPSTAVAPRLLDPQPGETVLDACAAPGGKAAILAQLMRNEGTLVACDSSGARLRRLSGNLKRLGVNAQVFIHDWAKSAPPPWGDLRFDRILLDVPCSNTGVMRRRVDVRWRIKLEEFRTLAALQLQLIKTAAALLKPGGTLVYSTCSLDAEENQEVVAKALADLPRLKLIETQQVLPQRDGFDGAYAAKLVFE